MAAKSTIALDINLNGKQAEQSVASFRQQLRIATQDLVAMSEKFGVTSVEAANAAKKVAGLKDAIGDAKALADTFNPDKKFVALSGALNGAVSGFSALQGAMGLFGSESEDVQKMLLKVNSAMALQQGISGIAGSIDSFKLLGSTIKTKVVTAFSTLKGAIASTGIGLLVIGITAVIANFDKLKNSSGWIGKVFSGIGDAIGWVLDKLEDLGDWLGITGDDEEELAARTERAQQRIKDAKEAAYENELKIARAVGKGVEEIEKRKRAEQLKTINQQLELFLGMQRVLGTMSFEWLDDAIAKLNILKANIETDQKVADIMANKPKGDGKTKKTDGYERLQLETDVDDKILAKKAETLGIQTNMEFEAHRKTMEMAELNTKGRIELDKYTAEEQKKIDELTYKGKIDLIQQTGAAIGELADLAGRDTAAGKALAVAQATINAGLGISEVWKAKNIYPEPFGTAVKIASSVTLGLNALKTIKQIKAVQIPGQGSGGGGSVPNLSASAPLQIQPNYTNTKLDPFALNQIGNAAARAYVIESDVSGNQEKIKRLNRAARIV